MTNPTDLLSNVANGKMEKIADQFMGALPAPQFEARVKRVLK